MTKKILVWIVLFCWHIIIANLIFLLWVKMADPTAEGDLDKFLKLIWLGEINGIQFSPSVTLLTIGVTVFFSIHEKIFISLPPKGIYDWLKFIVLYPIFAFVIGMIFGALILIALCVLFIIIMFLVIMPYTQGIDWVINHSSFYFEHPTSYLVRGDRVSILSYLLSAIYLSIFYLSFIRFPRKFYQEKKYDGESIVLFCKNRHVFLSKFYLIFLIYLTPSIFAWLYPVVRNIFMDTSNVNLHSEIIPVSFLILGYLFLSGLIITVFLILRNNIKTMKINLREELLEELMSQQDEKK